MTPLQPHPQQKPTSKAAATEFPAPSAHLLHSRIAEASSEGSTAEVPCAEPLAAELLSEPLSANSSWSHPQQNFSLEEDEETTSTTEASHKGCRSRVSFAKGPSSTAEATHEGSRNRITCAKCAPLFHSRTAEASNEGSTAEVRSHSQQNFSRSHSQQNSSWTTISGICLLSRMRQPHPRQKPATKAAAAEVP